MNRTSPIIVFVLMLGVVAGCRSDASREEEPIRRALEMEGASQQAERVHLAISEDGRPRLWMEADKLWRFEEDTVRVELAGEETPVQGAVFDSEGRKRATFKAGKVSYIEKEHTFILEYGVEVQTTEGQRLSTERLIWNERSRQWYAPGFVRYRTKEEEMQGYRLRADESLEHFSMAEITGQVIIRR